MNVYRLIYDALNINFKSYNKINESNILVKKGALKHEKTNFIFNFVFDDNESIRLSDKTRKS